MISGKVASWAAVVLLVTSSAAAQDAQPAPDPAAAAAQPAGPDEATINQARERFQTGIRLRDGGDCKGAILEFQASYDLVPRPNSLYNIAQCHERMFRYDLAIQFYERYLGEAPPDAEDRGAVQGAMGVLR